jgi:hypothetical protein
MVNIKVDGCKWTLQKIYKGGVLLWQISLIQGEKMMKGAVTGGG